MYCQRCGCSETKVLESRAIQAGQKIRRRRLCQRCSHRFTTYETEQAREFQLRKRDGHLQAYDRAKALRSLRVACQKRRIETAQLEELLAEVEEALLESAHTRPVTSEELGDRILEKLRTLDPVAYVRFASVYKNFNDPTEFKLILASMDDTASQTE